jgi:SNF2 family DNA or RNA helicase
MRGEVDVLVASARIIGTGFNLQNCHVMYMYSNSYSFEDRAQLEDRIHRNGQESDTVVYKDLIVRRTVDEQVYEVLQNKKDLLEFMRDKSLHEFIGRTKGDEE